jgi:hypothetical protein
VLRREVDELVRQLVVVLQRVNQRGLVDAQVKREA